MGTLAIFFFASLWSLIICGLGFYIGYTLGKGQEISIDEAIRKIRLPFRAVRDNSAGIKPLTPEQMARLKNPDELAQIERQRELLDR